MLRDGDVRDVDCRRVVWIVVAVRIVVAWIGRIVGEIANRTAWVLRIFGFRESLVHKRRRRGTGCIGVDVGGERDGQRIAGVHRPGTVEHILRRIGLPGRIKRSRVCRRKLAVVDRNVNGALPRRAEVARRTDVVQQRKILQHG